MRTITQTEACMLHAGTPKRCCTVTMVAIAWVQLHGSGLPGGCRTHTRLTGAAADCHAGSRMATHLQHAVDHETADDAEHAPRQLKPLIGLQPVDERFQAAA